LLGHAALRRLKSPLYPRRGGRATTTVARRRNPAGDRRRPVPIQRTRRRVEGGEPEGNLPHAGGSRGLPGDEPPPGPPAGRPPLPDNGGPGAGNRSRGHGAPVATAVKTGRSRRRLP